MKTVSKVQEELRHWKVGRVIWVCDRGMVSEETRVVFQRAGGGYILGERLRSGAEMVEEALSTPGRYRKVRENLWVKEIWIKRGTKRRRYILVYNPERADRDRAVREEILKALRLELARLKKLSRTEKALCRLRQNRVFKRYFDEAGLRIDREAVRREERLDGKYLLSTTEEDLSAKEVALAYRDLQEVERAFRELKHRFDIRPMYHRVEDRIRAHVTLCWLALFLARLVEMRGGVSFGRLRRELSRVCVVELEYEKEGRKDRILKWTEASPRVKKAYKVFGLKMPGELEIFPTGAEQA